VSRGTLESIALLVDRRARLQICCDQAGLLPRLFRLGMPDHRDGDLLIVQSSTTIMRRSAAGRVRATVRATGDLRPRVLHDRQDRLHLSGLIGGTDATSALITRPSVALPTLGLFGRVFRRAALIVQISPSAYIARATARSRADARRDCLDGSGFSERCGLACRHRG